MNQGIIKQMVRMEKSDSSTGVQHKCVGVHPLISTLENQKKEAKNN